MKKTMKKSKGPVTQSTRKVAIKDLKAKNAGTVKGGAGHWDIQANKKV
jgi:hypothetical protein